jgi:hypothetical protein
MKWLRTIVDEVVSLFVDDQRFALAIFAWPILIWLVAKAVPELRSLGGPILFIGLATILAVAALTRASK